MSTLLGVDFELEFLLELGSFFSRIAAFPLAVYLRDEFTVLPFLLYTLKLSVTLFYCIPLLTTKAPLVLPYFVDELHCISVLKIDDGRPESLFF